MDNSGSEIVFQLSIIHCAVAISEEANKKLWGGGSAAALPIRWRRLPHPSTSIHGSTAMTSWAASPTPRCSASSASFRRATRRRSSAGSRRSSSEIDSGKFEFSLSGRRHSHEYRAPVDREDRRRRRQAAHGAQPQRPSRSGHAALFCATRWRRSLSALANAATGDCQGGQEDIST